MQKLGWFGGLCVTQGHRKHSRGRADHVDRDSISAGRSAADTAAAAAALLPSTAISRRPSSPCPSRHPPPTSRWTTTTRTRMRMRRTVRTTTVLRRAVSAADSCRRSTSTPSPTTTSSSSRHRLFIMTSPRSAPSVGAAGSRVVPTAPPDIFPHPNCRKGDVAISSGGLHVRNN